MNMDGNLSEREKQEIHEIMGQPCRNCGSFNIWVKTKDGKSHPRGASEPYPRGSSAYKPEDVEYTFCNMCGNRW